MCKFIYINIFTCVCGLAEQLVVGFKYAYIYLRLCMYVLCCGYILRDRRVV